MRHPTPGQPNLARVHPVVSARGSRRPVTNISTFSFYIHPPNPPVYSQPSAPLPPGCGQIFQRDVFGSVISIGRTASNNASHLLPLPGKGAPAAGAADALSSHPSTQARRGPTWSTAILSNGINTLSSHHQPHIRRSPKPRSSDSWSTEGTDEIATPRQCI